VWKSVVSKNKSTYSLHYRENEKLFMRRFLWFWQFAERKLPDFCVQRCEEEYGHFAMRDAVILPSLTKDSRHWGDHSDMPDAGV